VLVPARRTGRTTIEITIWKGYRPTCGLNTFATAARFCRVFDEIRAFFHPQSHGNQSRTLAQRRRIHRERFAELMGMMAAV
jgi:putative transposase